MIIISSASYVSAELQIELGLIPPCMVPIGNKKLLELQVAACRSAFPHEKIRLSLPDSYQLNMIEQSVISELGIEVQSVPDDFTLAESLLFVLNTEIDKSFETIRVLQGSILLEQLPRESDIIGQIVGEREYNWFDVRRLANEEANWGGYFAFSSRLALITCLAISRGNFVKAIRLYQQRYALQPVDLVRWYDCGYLHTIIAARATITTQRAFNYLKIHGGIVTKSSSNNLKIQAEINWFKQIPVAIRRFIPQFIDDGVLPDQQTIFYCLEYLPILPLNELFVHGRNPPMFWQTIFDLVKEYFAIASSEKVVRGVDVAQLTQTSAQLYADKSLKRLETFSKSQHVDLDAPRNYHGEPIGSLREICQHCIDLTLQLPMVASVMHGDLCLSNMLFDSRSRHLKFIDPRGIDVNDQMTIFGNQTYDLAKLAHSIVGMYDFIVAGRYHVTDDPEFCEISFRRDERLNTIQQQFLQSELIAGLPTSAIMPAVVLLFLSMLPLHADRPDRQKAMLINALSLYHRYVMRSSHVCHTHGRAEQPVL